MKEYAYEGRRVRLRLGDSLSDWNGIITSFDYVAGSDLGFVTIRDDDPLGKPITRIVTNMGKTWDFL